MPLSDEEQRRLEQLEALLAEDDPRLAHTLRGTRPRHLTASRLAIGGIGFLAGIGLLIAGMQWHWSISVVGFLVMLAAASWLFLGRTPQRRDFEVDGAPDPSFSSLGARQRRQPRTGASRPAASQAAFMDKLEERWRRRQQGGR